MAKSKQIVPKIIQFTKEGFEDIKNQKIILEKKREEVLVRLVRAREMGDLSENSAYHGAKMELGSIDRRLRQIKIFLRFGIISGNENRNNIGIGSKVALSDGSNELAVEIVGDYESDPAKGKISRKSPVGLAIFGKSQGDEVEVRLPDKIIKYKIVKIDRSSQSL